MKNYTLNDEQQKRLAHLVAEANIARSDVNNRMRAQAEREGSLGYFPVQRCTQREMVDLILSFYGAADGPFNPRSKPTR